MIKLLKKFISYSIQDSSSLATALSIAQSQYFDDYKVDITTCLSASSLAFKIFRQNYLNIDIPLLKPSVEKDIRKSYYGGATDYYKVKLVEGKYYDVNSLYPFAMLNDMPLNFIKEEKGFNIRLEDVFGFVHCIITCPKDIANPLLLHNFNGKIIHPTGT